ncbi:M-phase phosphoprotein 6-like [Mytilus californianus]|uniref:M-phase phosphoprotein 6-like n=1 Tax=Mytilus californianus TaxID=6549 RepID=UPI002247B024|nr:M-phase phosphoprotein 6-like [Mytilus californianus]
MAGGSGQRGNLSKNVLQMKFMQRSALRIEKEKHEEEQKRVIDDEHWVLDLPETKQKESKFIAEPSIMRIENLKFGRFSFNGCNPEIEKMMKAAATERELARSEAVEKELRVDDEEMAGRYKTLFGTIAKKFAKKRQRSALTEKEEATTTEVKQRVREFLKPKDD